MWLPTTTIQLLLAFATCLNIGHVTSSPISPGRIINGETARPGEIPYQVSLQVADSYVHYCGGSILSANFVITVAHCVVRRLPEFTIVVAGTNDITPGQGIIRKVERIDIHEGYDPDDSYRNDIAIIKVLEPFVVIPNLLEYVKLPQADQMTYPGEDAVVSGWGRLAEGGHSPTLLQRVMIEISDEDYCFNTYVQSFGMKVDDSQICAEDPVATRGSCHGDSGGPLIAEDELTGLVSWANGCGRQGFPTVFTRVSEFLGWIEKTTGLNTTNTNDGM